MLSFFPRGVLDEILNLIESVSEGFPSYFCLFKPCERYPKTISKWIDPTSSKRKSRFSCKNKCVYTLNNLAYLMNKHFHTSINLRKVRLGSEIFIGAVLYFAPVQCGTRF